MLLNNQRAFNKHEIYGILKDYNWIVKEANRINLQLEGVESYGIQIITDEPKASGYNNKLEAEVVRRDKKHKRMVKYYEKINYIAQARDKITNDQEIALLDCMLDGMSINKIAIQMNVTRKTVERMRDRIVDKLG